MNNRIVSGLLACSIALAGCVDAASDKKASRPAPPPPAATVTTPGTLQSAHEAYLEGDFLAVGERIRDVLLDTRSSDDVKENALELLDKSYETQHGTLPSRFVLPPGFEDVSYNVTRGMTGQTPFFYVFVYGNTRDVSKLKRVSVRGLPGDVLLDSTPGSGKGSLKIKHDKPGYDTFVLQRELPALPSDGVLSLRFDLDDGTSSEGWFISRSQASSATPEIRTPIPWSSISDANPVASWVPFRSPEYRPFEVRTLNVYVGSEGAPGVAWSVWMGGYGELGAVKIGDHAATAQKAKLGPGDYWLNVACSEGRKFGPVSLTRESRAVSAFRVVAP